MGCIESKDIIEPLNIDQDHQQETETKFQAYCKTKKLEERM